MNEFNYKDLVMSNEELSKAVEALYLCNESLKAAFRELA